MADRLGVPFLGEIPLDTKIRLGGDTGLPVMVTEPDSALGEAFRQAAERIAAKVSVMNVQSAQGSLISAGSIPVIKR